YNDWLGEEYCAVSRDRLLGLGVIPWTNLDDALAELEHCARLGLKGVNLGVFPSGLGYPTPADDRFWAAAIEMRMPLTVHVGFDRQGPRAAQPTLQYPNADPKVIARLGGRTLVEWVALPFMGTAAAMSLSQIILSGVFDRLPALEIFFAETRLGWVPFWMEEADYWYERHRHWSERLLGFKPLARRPSEYVRRHIHFSVQHVERVAMSRPLPLAAAGVLSARTSPPFDSACRTPRRSPDRPWAAV